MKSRLKINNKILKQLEEASEALSGFLCHYAVWNEISEDGTKIENPLNKAIATIKGRRTNNENIRGTS